MPRQITARQSPVGESSRTGKHITKASPNRPPAATSLLSLLEISRRLQPRDYAVAHLLDEHTTLTTSQIAATLFSNVITCQHRLQALRRLGFLDRFIRNHPRNPRPMCWVLGPLGARYVSMARGGNPPTPKAVRDRQDRIFASPALDHLIGVNDFFVRLLGTTRSDGARLTRCWSERTTAAAYGRRIHPDGHGVWSATSGDTGFFLEYDTGTEPLGRLIAKLASHRRLRSEGGPDYPVLFVLPSQTREQNLHRKLTDGIDPGVGVATTSAEAGADPAGPVWRVFGSGTGRYTLSGLRSSHGEPGPLNPGPPAPGDEPLWVLRPAPGA